MKKFFIMGTVLLVIVLAFRERGENIRSTGNLAAGISPELSRAVSLSDESDHSRNLSSTTVIIPATSGTRPLGVADELMRANKERWNIQDYHSLHAAVFETPIGSEVRYTVFQGELPILGMEISVKLRGDLSVRAVDNRYLPVDKFEYESVHSLATEKIYSRLRSAAIEPIQNEELGLARVLVLSPAKTVLELAYVIPVRDVNRKWGHVLVRTTDGQILRRSFSRSEF